MPSPVTFDRCCWANGRSRRSCECMGSRFDPPNVASILDFVAGSAGADLAKATHRSCRAPFPVNRLRSRRVKRATDPRNDCALHHPHAAVAPAADRAARGDARDRWRVRRRDRRRAPKPIGSGGAGALVQNAGLGDQIVGNGSSAFAQRMGALREHPVVVNQWASRCESCRFELPFSFRRQYAAAATASRSSAWTPAISAMPPKRFCTRCRSGFRASVIATPPSRSHSAAAGHGR